VFENRELRRIFGPKREEVAGCWRRLHNEGLHITCMGKIINAYNILVGKAEGKRPLKRPIHR
jgi:hypothetical protein